MSAEHRRFKKAFLMTLWNEFRHELCLDKGRVARHAKPLLLHAEVFTHCSGEAHECAVLRDKPRCSLWLSATDSGSLNAAVSLLCFIAKAISLFQQSIFNKTQCRFPVSFGQARQAHGTARAHHTNMCTDGAASPTAPAPSRPANVVESYDVIFMYTS